MFQHHGGVHTDRSIHVSDQVKAGVVLRTWGQYEVAVSGLYGMTLAGHSHNTYSLFFLYHS